MYDQLPSQSSDGNPADAKDAAANAPSAVELTAIGKRQYTLSILLMVFGALLTCFASCEFGYPAWGYAVAAVVVAFNVRTTWRVTQRMRDNPAWAQKYAELSTAGIFDNIHLLIFIWGPLDRLDNYTDVLNTGQQLMCKDKIDEEWRAIWHESRAFWFLETPMVLLHLWGLQAIMLLLAVAVQYYIVRNAGTSVQSLHTMSGYYVDAIDLKYSDLIPVLTLGRPGGSSDPPLVLQEGEYLTAFEGMEDRAKKILWCLTVVTNKRTKQVSNWGHFETEKAKGKVGHLSEFSFSAEPGTEIVGLEREDAWCGSIKKIITRPVAGSSAGMSEAASLDLASMLGPAALMSEADPTQKAGRAFQVSFARVLLEASSQTCLAAMGFEFTFAKVHWTARMTQLLSLSLSMLSALPKARDLLKLSLSFAFAFPLCVCLLASLSWAAAKIVMAFCCDDHLWSLSTGCVDLGAANQTNTSG